MYDPVSVDIMMTAIIQRESMKAYQSFANGDNHVVYVADAKNQRRFNLVRRKQKEVVSLLDSFVDQELLNVQIEGNHRNYTPSDGSEDFWRALIAATKL